MKKLMDILFEAEEEVVVEAPLEEVKPFEKEVVKEVLKPKVEDVKKEEVKEINVEEKRVRSRSFGIIDVEELQVKKPSYKRSIAPVKEYEAQPNISPIFGIIEDPKRNEKPVLKTPQIQSNQNTSHLGTVLSPIYGMGTNPNTYQTFDEHEPSDPYAELEQIYEEYPEPDFENHSLAELLKEDEISLEEMEISLFDTVLKGDDK